MTREARFLIIATIIVVVAVIGFYVLAGHMRSGLNRAYPANIKQHLRLLGAGQAAHFRERHTYAIDVTRVWKPSAANSAQGVRLRIIAADSSGYLAEGRIAGWEGWCVLAAGTAAGDSLPPGEPVCHSD